MIRTYILIHLPRRSQVDLRSLSLSLPAWELFPQYGFLVTLPQNLLSVPLLQVCEPSSKTLMYTF